MPEHGYYVRKSAVLFVWDTWQVLFGGVIILALTQSVGTRKKYATVAGNL
ncbi:MAG: hypothetical protein ABFS56_14945 [Pseudomonadota bacterium]